MKSRLLLNLVLALVVIALVLVAVYEPGKAPPAELVSISQHKAGDISRLQILRPEHEPVVFIKQGSRWRMQKPFDMPADEEKLANLLRLLSAPSRGQYEFTAVDTQALGLDQPQLMIRFDDELMAFGSTEPLHKRRYVQAGNAIHLFDDRYTYLAQGTPASLLSPRLLQDDEKIAAVSAPLFQLRHEDGKWQMQGQQLGSADERQAFVDSWQHARAIKVVASNPDLTPSSDTVSIQIQGREAPLQFQLIKTADEIILRRSDKALDYVFGPAVAESLLQPAANNTQ